MQSNYWFKPLKAAVLLFWSLWLFEPISGLLFFFFLFFSFWDKRRMELKLLNNKSVITNKSGFYSSQQINHHIWWVIQKLKIRVKLYSHISKTVSTRLAQQLDSLNICVIEWLGKVFISFLQLVKRGSNIRWTAFGVD